MRLDFGIGLGGGLRRGGAVVSNPPDTPVAAHWAAAGFGAGEVGFAYDPSTPEALCQDAAGSIPVTADGDPVGLMRDQSGLGHDAVQPAAARRPTWRTDGSRGWLEFDGTNDELLVPQAALRQDATALVSVVTLTGGGTYPMILGDASLANGFTAGFGNGGSRVPRLGVSGQNPVVLMDGAAQPVGQRAAMAYIWDGAERAIIRDGVELARDAQTAPWIVGDQPLLCYSGSNVLKSPMQFYGAVCLNRAPSVAEQATWSARMGLPLPATGRATVLGDSTVAAYSGQPSVLSLLAGPRTPRDLAVPGHSIAQQLAAWQGAGVTASRDGYVMVQVGLNDLNPAEAASDAISQLQGLIDTVRADAGPMPVIIGQMTPARQRLLNFYGANGEASHAKWAAINAAIAGQGATPITGVDARVTDHVPMLGDGTERLAPAYDLGDGIHPNGAGRQVIADAWGAVLGDLGLI